MARLHSPASLTYPLGIRQSKFPALHGVGPTVQDTQLRCDLILGRHWNRIFQAATSLCLLTGTTGFVLTKTATGRDWAAGAGGGAFSRTELGTLTTSTTSGDIAPIALSEAITSGNIVEIIIDPTSANDGAIEYVSFVVGCMVGANVAQATEPAVGDTQVAIGLKVTRGNDDQSTDFG